MELAALDIKIGADLTKLQKDLNSAGVMVDVFAKDLATIGASGAAAAGGMAQVATGAAKITTAFKAIPASVHVLDDSLNAFANEFNQKWSKVVDEAQKLPVVIDNSSEAAKRLQRQFQAFGGLSPFKNAGADLSKFSLSTKDIPSKLQATQKASASATLALGNLGRVAQDLPFGFIGIANNLNPLLEGFQRLAVQAKAAGTSIGSTLLKSLTGAGGLGLALSVVSAALTFASFGLSAWTRGFGKNKEEIDAAKEALDGYLKNAADEITNLRILEKVATDTSNSYDVRIKAVNELQKLYPFYLKNLSDEAILNGAAAKQIDLVAAALAKKAYFQASERELQQIADKQLKARQEETKLIGKQQQAELDLKKAQLDRTKPSGVIGGSSFVVADESIAIGAIDAQERKLEKVNDQLEENRKTQQGLTNDFQYFLNVAESFKDETIQLDPDPQGKVKATTKDVETIADVLAKLKLELSAINVRELQEGLNLSSQKISEIEGVIKKLIVDFKVKPDDTIINKLFGDIKDIRFSSANFKEFIQNLEKTIPPEAVPKIPVKFIVDDKSFGDDFTKRMFEFQSALDTAMKLNIEVPDNIKNLFSIDGQGYKDFIDKVKSAKLSLQGLNDTIMATLSSGLQDFFTSIGDTLAGQDNPFKAFANIMSDGFKAIGQALIAYGIQVGIIQKVLANPFNPISPVLAIAAGIALQAAGAILENSLKGITGLAEGGVIPPGYPNDTYLARLSSNEAVIPLDKGLAPWMTNDMQPIVIIPEARISGNDIVISYERTQKKNKRTY